MNEIKSILFSTAPLEAASSTREYIVKGDPGATFSLIITNEDVHFYNFPENTVITNSDTESLPAAAFSSTPARLKPTTIGSSGVFTGSVTFPAVTDQDYYNVTFSAEKHYDTKISDELSVDDVYYLPKINQYLDTVVTFSLLSPLQEAGDEAYNTYPSNVTITGINSRVEKVANKKSKIFSWPITLNSSEFEILKQPDISDFEFTVTKRTKTAATDSKILELTDITGLTVGMKVGGSGIAADSVISEIHLGFKDVNISTAANPIYVVAKSVNALETGLTNETGGTVIITKDSTFVATRALTFTGSGSKAANSFNNTIFEISDLVLTIVPFVTTTTAAVAAGATVIPVTSAVGVKDDVSTVTGVGINSANTMTVTNISSLNLTVRALVANDNEALENGQTLTFPNTSRSAKITGKVSVLEYGLSDITLQLNLDNILTIA